MDIIKNKSNIGKTVFLQLAVLLALWLLLEFLAYLFTENILVNQKHDPDLMNSIGLQRMLIQRYQSEITTSIAAQAISDWETLLLFNRKAAQTATLLDQNFDAFLHGGKISLDTQGQRFQTIKPIQINKAIKAIVEAQREWQNLKQLATKILHMDINSIVGNPQYTKLANQANIAINRQDTAVSVIGKQLSEDNNFLMFIQLTILIISVVFFFITLAYSFFFIARPLSKATAALSQAHLFNQLILNNIEEGIYGLDLEGKTTFCNQAAVNMLGYTIAEMIDKPQHRLIHHSYPDGSEYPKENCKIYRSFTEGIVHHEDQEVFWKKDGCPVPVEYTSRPIRNENNKITGVVVVFRDITKRKQIESIILEAKEKAEESNRLKTEFINMISHELRTPLTVILGNVSILCNSVQEIDSKMVVAIAQDIKDSGEHLLTLINDLLDFSKIESGKMEINREQFQLQPYIDKIIAEIKPLTIAKQLIIATEVESIQISADPFRLKQILLNLLSNAIKFTPTGKIILQAKQDNQHIIFKVTDTGVGIKEDDIPIIFEVFRQADGSYKRVGGSGLGLSITKTLIALHGGTIDVTSTVGQGSTFTFTISQLENNTNKASA